MWACAVIFGPLLTFVVALAFGFGWHSYRNYREMHGE